MVFIHRKPSSDDSDAMPFVSDMITDTTLNKIKMIYEMI